MIQRMMEVLHSWVAGKDAEALFHEAQARHAPYGWVLPVDKLAVNPQLEARSWFADYEVAGTTVKGPGAPYQLSATPWRSKLAAGDNIPSDPEDLLAAMGWTGQGGVT